MVGVTASSDMKCTEVPFHLLDELTIHLLPPPCAHKICEKRSSRNNNK